MQKQIDKLQNHFILCGGGTTGEHIIEEFRTTRQSFVLIERDEENLGLLRERFPNLLGIRGNAMNEEVLQRAGIERAAGLVAALHTDSENMFVTVRARFLHPSLKIVAKCVDHGSADLFSAAGATYVVSPNFIGGMRMASEMIRPHVVSFLDRMLRGQDQTVRVSEVTVGEGARIAGQTIGEADLFGKVGLNVIATCTAGSDEFAYNPPPDLVLDPGRVLLVIGNVDQVAKLKSLAGAA